jgi:catechol 1,2-dioxygenase
MSEDIAYSERVDKVAWDMIETIKERLEANDVTHGEFLAAVQYLAKLAASGEVPLFLMVFFESAIERITFDKREGSKGAVQGPYHKDDHPALEAPYRLPMRDDEPGDPFVFSGKIVDVDGNGIAGVTVDTWQAGNDGTYSGFNPIPPEGNLRGILTTDENGEFRFSSIRPAPYQIPDTGPTGEFLVMTGRHSWRPAHLHFILSKDGYASLTSQIYFKGDVVIEGQGDIVDGVKPELLIDVGEGSDADIATTYGVSTPYQTGEYTFTLGPA